MPCCAGDDSELYFGLADLRGGDCDAIVSGHRDFQAAAEGVAVNGHDYWLAAIFDARQEIRQIQGAGVSRPSVILPNSLMSAPAMKVRPPPMRTRL